MVRSVRYLIRLPGTLFLLCMLLCYSLLLLQFRSFLLLIILEDVFMLELITDEEQRHINQHLETDRASAKQRLHRTDCKRRTQALCR